MLFKARQRIQSLSSLAFSSEALRQSLILLSAQGSTAVLLSISFLLASRALGPTWFGVFSVFTALVAVWMKIPDLGMNQAMITILGNSNQDIVQAKQRMWLILEWKVWASVILLVAGAIILPLLPEVLLFPWPVLITLSLLGGVFLAWFETMYTFLLGRHDFFAAGVLSVLQAIGKLCAFGLILWFANVQTGDRLNMISQFGMWYVLFPAGCALAFLPRLKRWLGARPRFGFKTAREFLLPLLTHTSIGTISVTLLQNLDVLLVQMQFSPHETGLYAGASRVALFVSLLTYTMSGVLNNRVSRYRDRANLQLYLQKSFSVVAFAILGFLTFLPLQDLVLNATLGSEYRASAPVLLILIANAFLSLALVPFMAVFYGQNQPSYFSTGGVMQVVSLIAVYFLGAATLGIQSMAWARLLATLVFAVFTLWKLWRLPVWQ